MLGETRSPYAIARRESAHHRTGCGDPILVFRPVARQAAEHPRARRGGQAKRHAESGMPADHRAGVVGMASSKDPGALGIYGFRNRAADSSVLQATGRSQMGTAVKEPRVWDILGTRNKNSIIIGVPGTFPITRPVRGAMVSCFLTPGIDNDYTWPRDLKKEVADVVGEYMIDVKGFRTDDKKWLLEQIYEMTDKRFKLTKASQCRRRSPGTLCWWSRWASTASTTASGNTWTRTQPPLRGGQSARTQRSASAILNTPPRHAHRRTAVGRRPGEDRGHARERSWAAKCMVGGLCFNDWLIREGYMTMKQEPATKPTKFAFDKRRLERRRRFGAKAATTAGASSNREGPRTAGHRAAGRV